MSDLQAAFRLTMTRDFDAPRELVFRQWMRAEDLAAWFAPETFEVTACALDARPGGAWRVTYRGRDGRVIEESGAFLTVKAPELLEMTLTQRFDDGSTGPDTRLRVEFIERSSRATRMVFRQTGFTSAAMRDGNENGWHTCFDKLDRHLAAVAEASHDRQGGRTAADGLVGRPSGEVLD